MLRMSSEDLLKKLQLILAKESIVSPYHGLTPAFA